MILHIVRRAWRLGEDVLGINSRNLDFIYRLNPRKYFPRADDKLLAKEILSRHGIPVPRTLAVFGGHADLRRLEAAVAGLDGFVVKPAQSFGGKGILIVRRDPSGALTAGAVDERSLAVEDIETHIVYILSGAYSLERLLDRAFLEQLLEPEDVLGGVSCKGVPDIRVIVREGRPVMSMVRLPTRRSGGRANLHQGALGLGVDMESGRTTHAILGNRSVESHPDTGRRLDGIQIPQWRVVVDMAVKAAGVTGLGYVGVDVVIDRHEGPLVIELNARPGLNIQLANREGLARKLHGGEGT